VPARRLSAPSVATRGRALFAAVAIGAVAAAVTGRSLLPTATPAALAVSGDTAVVGTDGDDSRSLEVRPVHRGLSASAEARQLATSQQITGQQSVDTPVRPGRTEDATFTSPAKGQVTATFGGQYGAFHYGIEIANVKNTPIVAAAEGVIIAAGPADGFGLWVKEQLPDGTTLVYARMDTFSVQVGQHVTAGQRIALMGDRGFGTGYTLHFEVWDPTGKKIDPESWLNDRGVTV
jgi:murein DD-endopeptidase MepM/ murein hydrolase activator NlpD